MGKDDKKEDSGFGFKDKNKALETIELLKKETASYQGLTVRGLLGRAKRTLKRKFLIIIAQFNSSIAI